MGDHGVEALLRIGDSCLVLAQRLTAWCGHAPALEEDIALANIALDVLGHARGMLTRAGELEGAGRDEDALAYLRSAPEYRNLLLVEQPNGDFAHTMLRQFFFDAWTTELWRELSSSSDAVVAGIAEKAAKEAAYHVRHSSGWVVRRGDRPEEGPARRSRARGCSPRSRTSGPTPVRPFSTTRSTSPLPTPVWRPCPRRSKSP